MTPTEALKLLDLAASTAAGTRHDHEGVKQATALLAELIEDYQKLKATPS
jgi:hypothetical protein